MGRADDVSRSVGAWRGLTVGVIALGLALSASAMPRWQKRVLIGKVTPTATEEALVFAPGTGFACKLIDETKPLAAQSTDDPCPEIRVRAYLKSGDTLLPGPTMVGTPIDGVRASWADWGKAAATWGSQADKLLPDANGNVKLGVYTTPMEGGCLPKLAVDAPAVDKAGEGCLSIHGTMDVPLRRLGEMRVEAALEALTADVKQSDETDGAMLLCAQDFKGCTDVRKLLPLAGCVEGAMRPACATFVDAIAAQEALRIPTILDGIQGATGRPSESGNWYALLDTIDHRPTQLGTFLERAHLVVTSEANRRFDSAVTEENASEAGRWIEVAEKYATSGQGMYNTKPGVAARRVKYTQLVARLEAQERAEAARREAQERPCVAGCMKLVVACDGNPSYCGGSCNYSNMCPCCTPAPSECKRGGTSRMVYNFDHPECK